MTWPHDVNRYFTRSLHLHACRQPVDAWRAEYLHVRSEESDRLLDFEFNVKAIFYWFGFLFCFFLLKKTHAACYGFSSGVVWQSTKLSLLTFLFKVAFQCNEIFIEDKINLRTVAFEERLQVTLVVDICRRQKKENVIYIFKETKDGCLLTEHNNKNSSSALQSKRVLHLNCVNATFTAMICSFFFILLPWAGKNRS